MEILALTILITSFLIGFAAIFFTTFGTLIVLLGAFSYALMTNFSVIGIKSLVVLSILYFIGELLEYVCIIVGAKKLGASNAAIIGALVGGILGASIGAAFLGVGLILGAFFGIFLGAFIVEAIIQKDLVKSLKAGTGGVLGRLGSILAKLVIVLIMLGIMVYSFISAQ